MQRSFKDEKPTLFLVSTPIGNLKDMTYRAVETLKAVDLILAEDTRTSGVLLSHYDIKTKMMSYHEFNKKEKEIEVLEMLKNNKHIALISDAGTPSISDPGYEITIAAIHQGFHVVPIPGASAILAALVVSGLVIQPFVFIGFLPRKKSDFKQTIQSYLDRRETLVIYESPLRITKTIEMIYDILGDRKVTLSRELTKIYETIIRTTLKEAITLDHQTKGEYVIIIEGAAKTVDLSLSIKEQVDLAIKTGLTEKDAMKQVAKDRQITKSEVYKAYKIDA